MASFTFRDIRGRDKAVATRLRRVQTADGCELRLCEYSWVQTTNLRNKHLIYPELFNKKLFEVKSIPIQCKYLVITVLCLIKNCLKLNPNVFWSWVQVCDQVNVSCDYFFILNLKTVHIFSHLTMTKPEMQHFVKKSVWIIMVIKNFNN